MLHPRLDSIVDIHAACCDSTEFYAKSMLEFYLTQHSTFAAKETHQPTPLKLLMFPL